MSAVSASCADGRLLCNRRHRNRRHAAGHDMGKVAEIVGDVESEAVAADPTAETYADGGNLAVTHPYARLLLDALRRYGALL